jgi:hypothetical protein
VDLNQNFIRTHRAGENALFIQRFNYHAAIFAANGFSERAESYALAHQIFLIEYTNTALLRPVINALLSLDLADFSHEQDADLRFAMTDLREEFRQAISRNGDIAAGAVFSERGLGKIRETLLPALGELRGSYYGMIQGIYPVHLISRRPISPGLILRQDGATITGSELCGKTRWRGVDDIVEHRMTVGDWRFETEIFSNGYKIFQFVLPPKAAVKI